MNSCMCAAVYFSKDNEELTCAIQDMEVRKIETIVETVQAKISNLKYRDQEIYGPEEAVDWTSGHWRNCSLLDQKIAAQLTSKMYVFSDSVLCHGGKSQS